MIRQQQQAQSGLSLPQNFGGTILYQPVIHIHCHSSNSSSATSNRTNSGNSSFRAIVPKEQNTSKSLKTSSRPVAKKK
jgi:hypothetical protein